MPVQTKLEELTAKEPKRSKYTFPLKSPRKLEKHKISTSLEENTENCTPKKMRRRTIYLDCKSEALDANTATKNVFSILNYFIIYITFYFSIRKKSCCLLIH